MLGLKLNHVSKKGHCCKLFSHEIYIDSDLLYIYHLHMILGNDFKTLSFSC